MIGRPRSRVSKFMNNFHKFGYILYNRRIHLHKALLNVVLHDRYRTKQLADRSWSITSRLQRAQGNARRSCSISAMDHGFYSTITADPLSVPSLTANNALFASSGENVVTCG